MKSRLLLFWYRLMVRKEGYIEYKELIQDPVRYFNLKNVIFNVCG